ncbi:hypothetical protein [Burkholderia cepacia]|uniref:hypothetical protein n=1 Tax=Burkholderia cepacia TaxID=292 RepID=UPI001E5A4CE3|nr:hypothetical protein [Burkholderia cepacia]
MPGHPAARTRLEHALQHKFTQLKYFARSVSRKASPCTPKKLTFGHIAASSTPAMIGALSAHRAIGVVRINICVVNSPIPATINSRCGIAQRQRTGIGLRALIHEAINNKESA